MVSREKAIEASRAKREAKEKKAAEGAAKRRAPGAGKPLHLLYSGQTSQQPVEPAAPTKKRPAAPESSPPPPKKSAVEKGKALAKEKSKSEGFGAAKLIPGPMPLVKMPDALIDQKVWELPKYSEPERLPGLPNDAALYENLGHPAAWEAFRATLFPKDLETSRSWKISSVLRQYATLSVLNNNLVYELASRANVMHTKGKELLKENEELKASGSKEKMKELEAKLEKVESELRAREIELSQAEEQITGLVSEKSKLEELAERHRRDSLEAFHRGEEKGRKAALTEKDAEFEKFLPAVRLKAVEDFVQGPVFTRSTLLVGENDVDSGWNRALGQVRAIGVTFDESKLDKSLDENLQPFAEEDEDEDEAFPDVEGKEFESVLDLVEEMVDRARDKKEEAARRRAELQADVVQTSESLPAAVIELPGPRNEEARTQEVPLRAEVEETRGDGASTSAVASADKN